MPTVYVTLIMIKSKIKTHFIVIVAVDHTRNTLIIVNLYII